jgi:hypothetical protein
MEKFGYARNEMARQRDRHPLAIGDGGPRIGNSARDLARKTVDIENCRKT